MRIDCEVQLEDLEDPILAELEQPRGQIPAESVGDFDAHLDSLDTREAENRERGLRHAVPLTSKAAATRPDGA